MKIEPRYAIMISLADREMLEIALNGLSEQKYLPEEFLETMTKKVTERPDIILLPIHIHEKPYVTDDQTRLRAWYNPNARQNAARMVFIQERVLKDENGQEVIFPLKAYMGTNAACLLFFRSTCCKNAPPSAVLMLPQNDGSVKPKILDPAAGINTARPKPFREGFVCYKPSAHRAILDKATHLHMFTHNLTVFRHDCVGADKLSMDQAAGVESRFSAGPA